MEGSTNTPIHYIVWRSQPGGAESLVKDYLERFSEDRDLYLYSLRTSENEISNSPGLRFDSGSDKNWRCYLQFFRYCLRHRAHLFHLVSTGPVTLFLALMAGVRNPVYHIHGTIYWKKAADRFYLKAIWRLISLFKVNFVANSEYSASVFQRKVLPVKPRVVYNGFSVEKFLQKRALRSGLRRMAYIGRLHTGKNVELVFRLFEDIAGTMPELELHIAGDGMLRKPLEDYAAASPYGSRIVFHGWVKDMASFYASVDLFVFLSAYESFGNVLAEALMTGLPVLTSNLPAFEEIYGGEKAFILGPPENFEALRKKFAQSVGEYPDLAKKAYELGEHLDKTFRMEAHLASIEKVYAQREAAG